MKFKDTHFFSYLKKSALGHGFFIILGTLHLFFSSHQQIIYTPAIKVDLVALPEKQPPKAIMPPKQNKPLPQKTKPLPSKTPPPPPPKPVAKKSTAKKSPRKASIKKAPSQEFDFRAEQNDVRRKAIERLESLQRVEKMLADQRLLKGNRISPGTALKGINKIDYDDYIGRLHQHVQSHWQLPTWLAVVENLSTIVKVYVNANGYVMKKQLMASSGDARFDQIVLSAIDKASPFPKPEDRFVDLMQAGITHHLKP